MLSPPLTYDLKIR